MKKTDVLVIGSSAAGLVAAVTGKSVNSKKDFTVITKQPKTLIPCGIPYVFGSVENTGNDILPAEKMFDNSGINQIIDEVISLNRDKKVVILKNGEEISYDKLVLAIGSSPIKPKWLKGNDLENVFTVPKDKVYLDKMQSIIKNCKKIVVIGAGFIGVEMSDEIKKTGKEVTLIERLPKILGMAFDEDVANRVDGILTARGINIIKGTGVKEIKGNGKVKSVLLENDQEVEADAVILAMGYSPNSELAKNAGLPINNYGFIKVDEYMRTEDPDIFAIGDCAEKRDFITRKTSPIMLASTACAEARIAGMNIFKLSAVKTFSGTISIFASAIGNSGFGVAGLTEPVAEKEGFDFVTGIFEGIDRHPGTLKDTHTQFIKLIVARESGVILGGEVFGGLSAGELTNLIGIIIQNRMNIYTLLTSQIGTHPLLTASPAGYPLMKATENAAAKLRA